MAGSKRQFQEVPEQGIEEKVAYTIDTTPYPAGPANAAAVTVKVYDADLVDVTSTVTTGSIAVSGRTITTLAIQSLTEDATYRLEVKWTGTDGNIFGIYGFIVARR